MKPPTLQEWDYAWNTYIRQITDYLEPKDIDKYYNEYSINIMNSELNRIRESQEVFGYKLPQVYVENKDATIYLGDPSLIVRVLN